MEFIDRFFQRVTAQISSRLTRPLSPERLRRVQLALLAVTVLLSTFAIAYPGFLRSEIDLSPGGPWDAGKAAPNDYVADTRIQFVREDQLEKARASAARQAPLHFTRDFGVLQSPDASGASAAPESDAPPTFRALLAADLAVFARCRAEAGGLDSIEACIRARAAGFRRLSREELRSLIYTRLPIEEKVAQLGNLIFERFVILSERPDHELYTESDAVHLIVQDVNRPGARKHRLIKDDVELTRGELPGAAAQSEIAGLALSRMGDVGAVQRRAFRKLAVYYLTRVSGVRFNPGATEEERKAAREAVAVTDHVLRYVRGQTIVQKDQVITEDILRALRIHQETRVWELIQRVVAIFVQFALLTALLLYLAQRFAANQLQDLASNLIIFSTLWGFALTLLALAQLWAAPGNQNEITHFFGAWVPIAPFVILFAIIFGELLALPLAFYMAFMVFLASKYDGASLMIALAVGLIAAILGARITRRVQFISVWIALTVVAAALTCVGFLYYNRPIFAGPGAEAWLSEGFVSALGAAGIAGLGALAVIGVLPIYEALFNAPTRFKLQELADPSHPLLQEMFKRAPSTWTHTLMVAALVEKACERLGLNVPLARTGIYFHDIGKMKNAAFFIENQHLMPRPENIDPDKPQEAARIIIDHVLDGIKMAEHYRLPREVIAFIPEHHGTSTMAFFYHKALEKMKRRVNRDDFRYPGPRPRSKETGIAMIADSVEAASRSLDEVTGESVGNLIQRIIQIKLQENQLDESGLTVGDLTVIREAFKDVLLSSLHSRPRYPDQNETNKLEAANRKRPGGGAASASRAGASSGARSARERGAGSAAAKARTSAPRVRKKTVR